MGGMLLCLGFLLLTSSISLGADVHERCQFGVDAAKQSAKAVSELGYKLFDKFSKPEENLVFSPVSIALGIALLESGAEGETHNEIERHLSPPGSNHLDSSTFYESLQRQLQIKGGDKTTLSLANGFFYSQELNVKPDFINRTTQCFETRVEKAPFKSNSEEARRQINQWINEKTAHKIPELFKPRSIDASTVAVLANALHLKAAWSNKFERSENLPFYKFGRSNAAQSVSFMVREGRYSHAENEKAHVVEIPYEGASSMSMFILLPKQRDGLNSLLSSGTKEEIRSLATGATFKTVNLKVPKFTLRSAFDLQNALQQLGINKIFSNQADFSRMATGRLKVSKAVHEAFIKVNENGTEASAATGFAILPGAAPALGPPVSVIADHPFGFSIVHKPTKAVLFAGKVVKIEQD